MKGLLQIFGSLLLMLLAMALSLGILRGCATLFAKPNSHTWEDAYVSESPSVKKYHHDENCKYLRQSKYDYEIISVDDAEHKRNLEPCKYCLEQHKKEQFDSYSGLLFFPIFFLIIWITGLLSKLKNKYTFQCLIVKKPDNNEAQYIERKRERMTSMAMYVAESRKNDKEYSFKVMKVVSDNLKELRESFTKRESDVCHRIMYLAQAFVNRKYLLNEDACKLSKLLEETKGHPTRKNAKQLLDIMSSGHQSKMVATALAWEYIESKTQKPPVS